MDFVEKHKKDVFGLLHGFDRLIFRGYINSFFSKSIYYYLSKQGIKLTGYKQFVEQETDLLKKHIEQLGQTSNVNIHYLNNSKANKEAIAKEDLAQHPTKTGLISIIKCIELNQTLRINKDKLKKELTIKKDLGPHLHYYLYYMDPEFGWMHIRIQSWLPFSMQVYINGREYLKRSLDKAGIAYESYNNSITWVEDLAKAQELADTLIKKKWQRVLQVFAKRVNPLLGKIEQVFDGKSYMWCLHQMEYATDILFKERNVLEQYYPALLEHATHLRGGEDIYTFFGRNLHGNCTKEVTGNNKRFTQGFRVKHTLDRNTIKMYDKHTVLRVETTINNPRTFKIYKTVERKGQQVQAWVPMGKSVSNIYRYAEIARSANTKYLNSLAGVDQPKNLQKQVEQMSQTTCVKNRNNNYRNFSAFNLLSKPTSLVLEAINDARFCIQSFSNKQLRGILQEKGFFESKGQDPLNEKQISGKVTRLIAKLKAHKLIFRLAKSFKYKLTKSGQNVCNKILMFKKLQLNVD